MAGAELVDGRSLGFIPSMSCVFGSRGSMSAGALPLAELQYLCLRTGCQAAASTLSDYGRRA